MVSPLPTRSYVALAALVTLTACAGTRDAPDPAAAMPTVPAPPPPTESGWISLFNGVDLTGWTPKFTGSPLGENLRDTFRVVDGELRVSYDAWDGFAGEFGHLVHDVPYDHYRLRLEVRFLGEQVAGGPGWAWRNSGIMVHGQDPATMTLDQSFPVSIEVQLLGGGEEGERPTGNLCTPGTNVAFAHELVTRHCTSSSSPTFRGDDWVTIEVEVRGHELVRHLVEGQSVLEYGAPQLDPDDADAQRLLDAGVAPELGGGWISLQAESHPVEFRRIELYPL